MGCFLIVRNKFIRNLKNKKKLIFNLIIPFLSIMLAIFINNIMKPSIKIGFIENEYVNENVIELTDNVEGIEVQKANKDSINTDMILGKYLAVVEFNDSNDVQVYSFDENMKYVISEELNSMIQTGEVNKLDGILADLNKDQLSPLQRSMGFIFITLTVTCTLAITSILKDKDDKILLRYCTTPSKLSTYMWGSYIYNIIMTVFEVVITSVFLYLLNIEVGVSMLAFNVIGIIIALICCTIAMFIVVISTNELKASLLASSIGLITALFGGAFLPIEKMPDMLRVISNVSIVRWILETTSFMEGGSLFKTSFILVILCCIVISNISIKAGIIRLKKIYI